jgi:hypothetical protein
LVRRINLLDERIAAAASVSDNSIAKCYDARFKVAAASDLYAIDEK